MPGVDEHQLKAILEHRPHRLPINAGGLHRDLPDPQRLQPVAQRQQTMNGRRKLRHALLKLTTLPDTNARGHARLVHIQRAGALNDPLHHQFPSIQIDNDHRPRELRVTSDAVARAQGNSPGFRPKPPRQT